MRIAVSQFHEDHTEYFNLCKVYLEGSERNNVVFADEKGRHAIVYQMNCDDGTKILDKHGIAKTTHFYGSVRIEAPFWLREQIEAKQAPKTDEGV